MPKRKKSPAEVTYSSARPIFRPNPVPLDPTMSYGRAATLAVMILELAKTNPVDLSGWADMIDQVNQRLIEAGHLAELVARKAGDYPNYIEYLLRLEKLE